MQFQALDSHLIALSGDRRPQVPRLIALALAAALLTGACGGSATEGAAGAPDREVLPADAVSVQFTSTSAEIANPERGFYRWAWSDLDQLSQDDAADAYANGFRLLYAMVRLDAYRSAELPATLLNGLRSGFANARLAGVKLVPRFVYNYPESETEYRNATDASLDQVLAHIAQLKPVLQDHADVIAYLQAGFIGAWGEWHTSSNNLTSAGSRTRIRDALLDALPSQQFVQFRYPAHLIDWLPTLPGEAAAFSGTAASRSAFHNDCFLASPTDVGTYSDDAATRQGQRDYMAALAKVAPFGGETCNPADDPDALPRTDCSDILQEGRQFSLTYLNNDYYTDLFHDRWRQQGCYAEVKRLMGYRLELVSAAHPQAVARAQALAVQFTIRNVGWARPYNPRVVKLLLRHRGTGQVLQFPVSQVDPRRWVAGATLTHDVTVTIPSNAATGSYDIHLALPDAADRLGADARFAVRPANADDAARGQGWDAQLGAFRFGSVVNVQ